LDGGITVMLHCPGYPVDPRFTIEDLSVDVYATSRELSVPGLSEQLAILVQLFGELVAEAHLKRFMHRLRAEGNPEIGIAHDGMRSTPSTTSSSH